MDPSLRDELNISLFHLFLLRNRIHETLVSLNDLAKIDKLSLPARSGKTIRRGLISYIDITAVAYFDEYDSHTAPVIKKLDKGELLKKIKQVRKDLEKKWPDSKMYRNEILAHHYRDKTGKSLFDYSTIKQYKIPLILKEKVLVYEMIGKITALLANDFPEHFSFWENQIATNTIKEQSKSLF